MRWAFRVARYALITADADAGVGIFDGTSFRYGEDDMAAFKGEYAANTVWGNAEKQKWRRGAQRGEQLQQKRGERAVAVWLR